MKSSVVAPALAVAAALAAGPAVADECAMSYSLFEATVPHVDLAECPAALARDGAFCRLALGAEEAHVFVFDDTSSCLLATKSFDEEAFQVSLK
jgi:hypothetical protein